MFATKLLLLVVIRRKLVHCTVQWADYVYSWETLPLQRVIFKSLTVWRRIILSLNLLQQFTRRY